MSATLLAGRYEVIRPLGHGAMAVVDLARDVELDRPVAVKRLAENLARDDDLRRRFLREARLAARLSHPHVVRVFDVGVDEGGLPFIAMEYVEGETLAELIARRGKLPAAEAAALGIQICSGLAAVHGAGLVHRDVKPQNLLLGKDGTLKLGDFGIAVGPEGTRLTLAGTVLGTAGYLAPEQARGEQVTAAADIYAVGAVLYELLTADLPPERPRAPRGVPDELASLVLACLAARPEDRPASAAAVARRLAPLTGEAETLTLPADPAVRATQILGPREPSPRRRPWIPLAVAAAALAALAAGIAIAVATSGGGHPARTRTGRTVQVVPPASGSTPAQGARNIAAWVRRHAR